MNKTIGFIGCGNMGSAIVSGILNKGILASEQVVVSDTNKEQVSKIAQAFGIRHGSNQDAAEQDILVLSVKPHVMEDILEEIKYFIRPDQIIITIAVGLTISFYKKILGNSIKFVRVLPNTPVAIGEGMSALSYQEPTMPEDVDLVQSLFDAIGKTIVIEEPLMNTVSALSGSGPALVDIFIEALADGAVRYGLPRQTAYEIAAQTLLGAAKLALETKQHPAVLKDQVCSPAGTTIEAVATLEKHGFRYAVIDAIGACVKKAETM